MPKRRLKGAAEILDVINHDPSRGQAFWFLHANHSEILAQSQGKRIPWQAVLAKVQALGLTNAGGNPVTSTKALMKTWSRVCDLKRREAEAKQQRVVAGRRPTNDPPPVVAQTVAPAPVLARPWTAAPAAVVPKTAIRTPEEQTQWLRNEILRRSGKRVR